MPLCPIDNVQLTPFTEDVSAQQFWECPKHFGRYVSHGIAGLLPIPRAIIAASSSSSSGLPPESKAILGYYYDSNAKRVYLKVDGDSEWMPSGGDMTYLELNATGLSAGNNNLTDVNWNESKVHVDNIKIAVTAGVVTDFDIAVYEKDTFLDADKRYEAKGLNSTDGWEDDLEWTYIDDDDAKEVHLKIIENAGTGTYAIQIRGVRLI